LHLFPLNTFSPSIAIDEDVVVVKWHRLQICQRIMGSKVMASEGHMTSRYIFCCKSWGKTCSVGMNGSRKQGCSSKTKPKSIIRDSSEPRYRSSTLPQK
jgi:hypothetical protein